VGLGSPAHDRGIKNIEGRVQAGRTVVWLAMSAAFDLPEETKTFDRSVGVTTLVPSGSFPFSNFSEK